jgi:DNA-binding GntR family transcriptional regulator
MDKGPNRRPSCVDRVVEHVFRKIVSGEFPPGAKLTEDQLATQVDVSRTPVREAVKRLADLGLIVVRPRSGLEVAAVDEQDVREVRVVREALEVLAVQLAAPRLTETDIERLQAIQQQCEKLVEAGADRLRIFRQDSRLHLTLVRMAGNGHLTDTFKRLDAKVMLCRMHLCADREKIARDVRDHRDILAALENGDLETAEQRLRSHIHATPLAREAVA